jgi:hypothetical protein
VKSSAAASLPLRTEDVDPPVQDAAVERDVVLLALQLEDQSAELVGGQGRDVRKLLVVLLGRIASALEDRALERGRRRKVERAVLDLVTKAHDARVAQHVDAAVEVASAHRDGLLFLLGAADEACQIVVAQTREVGKRIHSQLDTFRPEAGTD